MPKRTIIEVPGMRRHRNPIPSAVCVGDTIYSSVIGGYDFDSGDMPEDAKAQAANAFANLERLVEAGGGTLDGVALIDVLLGDMENRAFINDAWLAMFPDENNRPARHTQQADLPDGVQVHLKVVAKI